MVGATAASTEPPTAAGLAAASFCATHLFLLPRSFLPIQLALEGLGRALLQSDLPLGLAPSQAHFVFSQASRDELLDPIIAHE